MFENRAAAVTSPSASRVRSVDLPKRQRARRTNDPFAGIDTNTARGRRIADLVRAYLLALGSPPEIERQAEVIAAAELQVLAGAQARRAPRCSRGALLLPSEQAEPFGRISHHGPPEGHGGATGRKVLPVAEVLARREAEVLARRDQKC
jgi:hypothetical protein